MVDFSRSANCATAGEQVQRDAEIFDETCREDDAKRDAASKKVVTITLVREPTTQILPSGKRVTLLSGNEEGRPSALAAVHVVSPRVGENMHSEVAFDGKLRALGGGDRVTLAGQWARRGWTDPSGKRRESWEFNAQHFAAGEHTLAAMLEIAREERLELTSLAREAQAALGAVLGGGDVRAAVGAARAAVRASFGMG